MHWRAQISASVTSRSQNSFRPPGSSGTFSGEKVAEQILWGGASGRSAALGKASVGRAALSFLGVERLNELEYVKGEVLANVWQTERIARISPKTLRTIMAHHGTVVCQIADIARTRQTIGNLESAIATLTGRSPQVPFGDTLSAARRVWKRRLHISLFAPVSRVVQRCRS